MALSSLCSYRERREANNKASRDSKYRQKMELQRLRRENEFLRTACNMFDQRMANCTCGQRQALMSA